MSIKKSEIKVSINCQLCKTGVMKTVAKFTGVEEIKLDADKGILTIIGSADPICITVKLRKAGYHADITSVGPPKKPDVKDKDKDKDKNKDKDKDMKPLPPCCRQCELVSVSYVTYTNPAACSIL